MEKPTPNYLLLSMLKLGCAPLLQKIPTHGELGLILGQPARQIVLHVRAMIPGVPDLAQILTMVDAVIQVILQV
jgi:hypothetical protein